MAPGGAGAAYPAVMALTPTGIRGLIFAALASFGLSIGAKLLLPSVPFMDRVGYVFLACCAIMVIDALIERKPQENAVELGDIYFSTSTGYWIGSGVVFAGLVALYGAFW